MCEPTTIMMTMGALSAASTAVGFYGQQKTANAQAKAMTAQAQQEQNALQLQSNQLGQSAAQQMTERNRAALAEAAAFDAIAGEYGGGATASREAAAIAFNRQNDLSTIAANRNAQLAQLGQEAQGAGARHQAGLASLNRPSALGAALTIGGQLAGGYANAKLYEANKAAVAAKHTR